VAARALPSFPVMLVAVFFNSYAAMAVLMVLMFAVLATT